jgi:integrase
MSGALVVIDRRSGRGALHSGRAPVPPRECRGEDRRTPVQVRETRQSSALPFLAIQHSTLLKIADAHRWRKKTYNNAISALRRAFEFGFLDYPERHNPAAALKCARMSKKDRPRIDPFSIQDAEVLIAALHRDWGEAQSNYDEFRFFTGLRPSEEIALLATDYDAAKGILNITKARVDGIDKDATKTGEDRLILLCPRAVAILERQLRLREQFVGAGLLRHNHLFFTASGEPMRDLKYPYWRWQRTLRRLPIRCRKPYLARHTSVSWNLMLGHNPLRVAKEHGHRISTMFAVYAAWIEGTVEADVGAISDAMNRTSGEVANPAPVRVAPVTQTAPSPKDDVSAFPAQVRLFGAVNPHQTEFASGKANSRPPLGINPLKLKDFIGGKGGTRTLDPGIMSRPVGSR